MKYVKRKGQDLAEWGIIVAFVSAVAVATLFALEPHMLQTLHSISNALQNTNTLEQQ